MFLSHIHHHLVMRLKIKFFASHLPSNIKVTETIIHGTNVMVCWPVVLKYHFIAVVVVNSNISRR